MKICDPDSHQHFGAMQRVFNTVELVENILRFVSPSDQRAIGGVSSGFQAVIASSPLLQKIAFQQHAGNVSPSLPPYKIRATAIALTRTHGAVGVSIRSSLCTHWSWYRTVLRKSRLRELLLSQPPPLRARFWADCACASCKKELERDQGLRFRDVFDAIDGLGRPRCRVCSMVYYVRVLGLCGR